MSYNCDQIQPQFVPPLVNDVTSKHQQYSHNNINSYPTYPLNVHLPVTSPSTNRNMPTYNTQACTRVRHMQSRLHLLFLWRKFFLFVCVFVIRLSIIKLIVIVAQNGTQFQGGVVNKPTTRSGSRHRDNNVFEYV